MIIKRIGMIVVEIAEKNKTKQNNQNKTKTNQNKTKQNKQTNKQNPFIFKFGRVRPGVRVPSFHNFGNLGGQLKSKYDTMTPLARNGKATYTIMHYLTGGIKNVLLKRRIK